MRTLTRNVVLRQPVIRRREDGVDVDTARRLLQLLSLLLNPDHQAEVAMQPLDGVFLFVRENLRKEIRQLGLGVNRWFSLAVVDHLNGRSQVRVEQDTDEFGSIEAVTTASYFLLLFV